jgi:integrase/recombinase XerD
MRTDELPEHTHDFLGSLGAERGLAHNTVIAYRRDLVQYQRTIALNDSIPTTETVQRHLEDLRNAGLSRSSIARKFASIRAYHRFLVIEGLRGDDPTAAVGTPRRATSLPKALSISEVSAVLDQPNVDSAVGVRDLAILEFLYATGCRVSELTGADVHDIDFETSSVMLTGKGDKQRIVPIGSYAITAIDRWLPLRMETSINASDTGALFVSVRGNRLSRQAVWRIVRQHGKAAGVDEGRLSPHVFRHSAATHMVEGGADLRTVQEMLGHVSLSTTQIYTKISPEHLREVLLMSHPRGGSRT